MSTVVIALLFGVGVGAFAWTKLERLTGNASPRNTYLGAGFAGLVAFLFLLSLLKWVLNF